MVDMTGQFKTRGAILPVTIDYLANIIKSYIFVAFVEVVMLKCSNCNL